jgi:hypothetical protein
MSVQVQMPVQVQPSATATFTVQDKVATKAWFCEEVGEDKAATPMQKDYTSQQLQDNSLFIPLKEDQRVKERHARKLEQL